MGTLKLAYPLLLSLFLALVLCSENDVAEDDTSSNGNDVADEYVVYEVTYDPDSDTYEWEEYVYETTTTRKRTSTYTEETTVESDTEYDSETEVEVEVEDVDTPGGDGESPDGEDDDTPDTPGGDNDTPGTSGGDDKPSDTPDDDDQSSKDGNKQPPESPDDEEKTPQPGDSENSIPQEDEEPDSPEEGDVPERDLFNEETDVNKIPEDDESLYKKKRDFLNALTVRDLKKKEVRRKLFKYFRFNIKREKVLRFLKHCYRHRRKPKHHNKTFKHLIRKIRNSGKKEVPDEVYDDYNKGTTKPDDDDENNTPDDDNDDIDDETPGLLDEETKVSDIPEDDEKTYKTKHNFLKKITFKDLKKKEIRKKFIKIFRYSVKIEETFKFIKHCYRFRKKPKNHNKMFKQCIKKVKNSGRLEVPDKLFDDYNKGVEPDEDDDDTDEDTPEGNKPGDNPRKGGNKSKPGDDDDTDDDMPGGKGKNKKPGKGKKPGDKKSPGDDDDDDQPGKKPGKGKKTKKARTAKETW